MDLKKLMKSKVCKKIVLFFHENPASIDTPRGIATWTNQDLNKVKNALKRLVAGGVLTAHKVTSTTGYSYTRHKKIISQIERLLQEEKL